MLDEKMISDLIVYCYSFYEYDMYKLRELDEIQSIIEAIPNNKGFARNGIYFDRTFNYLENNASVFSKEITFIKNIYKSKLSLNDFISICRNKLNLSKEMDWI